jgi:hypothetical protein
VNNVYVNGVLNNAIRHTAFCGSYTGVLVFGQEQDSLAGGFQAAQAADVYIDTIAVYNRSWSASYISSLGASGKTCVNQYDTSLHALWVGDNSLDQSGNGYNAAVSAFETTAGVAGICPDPTATPTVSSLPTIAPTYFEKPTSLPSELPTHIPTSQPSRIPTPLPTIRPTVSLKPTPQPTPIPTHVPTHTPTLLPSPLPTDSPIPAPTPAPSITSRPTSTPTPLPTNTPSNLPTLLPSPLPTSAPSVYCGVGTYYENGQCIDCAIGRYSNVANAPWPTNCSLCPVGKYNTNVAQSSCIDCSSGKLSSSDRTFCEDCEAGEYNYAGIACVSCEYGKYAPTAQTDACLKCDAGFKTNNATGSTLCTSCEAGTYSIGQVDYCEECPAGKIFLNTVTILRNRHECINL